MADYRELLRKAVDALPENNGAARRQVYEKARSALVSQLRAINPPLPPRDITQHRLQLEDCIRQVEQQATDALLGDLKQLDTEETPVEAAPAEATPEPPETVEADSSEAEVGAPETVREEVEPEATVEEPVAPVVDEETAALQAALRAQEEAPEVPQGEPEVTTEATEPVAVEPTPQSEAAPLEVTEPEPQNNETAEPVVVSQPEPEPVSEVVPEPISEPEPASETVPEVEAEEEPAPEPVAEPEVATQPIVEAAPTPVEHTTPITSDVVSSEPPQPEAPKPGSIDYMIAQAQAAADRAAIPTRWQTDGGAPSLASATSAEAAMAAVASSSDSVAVPETPVVSPTAGSMASPTAMSAEREVDVEAPETDKKQDEAQVAIDRAIETLDREARGESTGEARSDGPAETKTTLAGDLPPTEDERGGGNAVTIFLLLFALLLAGVGGAGYWAWREGYIDIETMFAQGETPTEAVVTNTEPVTDTADVEETPTGPGNTAATPDAVAPVSEELVNNNEERLVAETSETPAVVEQTPVEPVEVPLPDEDAKIEDRLPTTETFDNGNGETAPAAENGEAVVADTEATPALAPVGAQSLLLEASSEGTTGAVPFSGTVDWSRGVDELGQPTLLATANIPARNLSVDLLIRRNADPTLPASHLMEVDFDVTESFIGGAIAGLPGVLLKNEELVRGVPLVGASARVIGNSFLFALSASDQDIGTNTNLLRSRKWMDLAMVYATGNRAIITLEKDEAAQALFDEVMTAWAEAAEAETPAAQ